MPNSIVGAPILFLFYLFIEDGDRVLVVEADAFPVFSAESEALKGICNISHIVYFLSL